MITIPPYLKKGDTIAIVCPSGYMPFEKAKTCIEVLQQWGYKVKIGKTLGSQFHYFSGTDDERLQDLQEMLDDNMVNAVLCARGGYGLSRIIDAIDFKKFKKKPKWIIGFSDITLLHAHIYQKLKIATLHAPMAAAFNDGGSENEFVQSLKKALRGVSAKYACDVHVLNRSGKASGALVGGNLSLLAHSIGSVSAYQTKNAILFLEDVGEYIYNVDRMMIQLKRSGMLQNLAGLIIGGFTEMKDTVIPFGEEVLSVIHHHVKEYAYPVCFDFPVSHATNNYALKIGVEYELNVGSKKVELKEVR
ncbi:MAG: LD-carboxypeptidase [Bacteroidota bacterium]|nr:LD-carboxypeptidase [Bacteroidota bacterium]